MQTIYEPKGKAREYSPLALNIYKGCDHGCSYCYVVNMMKRFNSEYVHHDVKNKPGFVASLKKVAEKGIIKKQVLLSFTGDPYCKANSIYKETRKVLEVLLKNKIPVRILSKGGSRILEDLDIFKEFGNNIIVGSTLTFSNKKDSLEWEPNASLPEKRLNVLKTLHDNGIRTWSSFEPVIIPSQSLELMEKTLDFVDEYKIGKINHNIEIEKKIDWNDFLEKTVHLMRVNKKSFYIKDDLAKYKQKTFFESKERNKDFLNLKWIA